MAIKQCLMGATSILSITAITTLGAHAQNAGIETVVVTGSQISQSSGYLAPTPVTTVSAQDLQDARPGTLSDGLNDLPQFRGSSRPQAGGVSANGAAGSNTLNLRNLGEQRTLVLLDGKRFVAGTDSGAVDINQLPQGLVQRVDVVTGGASAAYGSDAVAGVVNFVLEKHFVGLKGMVQGGLSTYGDVSQKKASLTYGTSLADGRLHLEGNFEYFYSGGLGPNESKRKWNQGSFGLIPNVAGVKPGQLILANGITVSAATYGGLITSGPLKGTTFGPGGVPVPFSYGSDVGASFMIGGDGIRNNANLSGDLNRVGFFAHADYDVSKNLNIYGEVSFSQAKTGWDQYYNYSYSTNSATIFSDNAYLPASVAASMVANKVTSFTLGRIHSENDIKALNSKQLLRFVVGANGEINDDWSYRAYFTHGQNKTEIGNANTLIYHNYYAAVDAVRNSAGTIVCRSTLSGLDPGCVPFNPFGAGSPSKAALGYVEGTEYRYLTLTQDFFSATVEGDNLFSLWSDPASIAFGGEYRAESSAQNTTPFAQTTIDCTGVRGCPSTLQGQLGPFIVGNPQPLSGSFNIKEGFVEFSVPIAHAMPMVQELNFDGAARVADYSTSGVVYTWKASLSYKPIDDIRFRATRSHDIRGPNTAELFTGSSQGIGTALYPATGAPGVKTVDVTTKSSGNPNLNPETSDTWTAGIVLTPTFLDGVEASFDYYHINISDAISTLGRQQAFDQCYQGNATACANIANVGTNAYVVQLPYLNLNSLKTEGFDIEASYDTDLWGGHFNLHGLVNNQARYQTQTPGSAAINYAREVGISSNPVWEGNVAASYSYGPLATTLTERWIGSGRYNIQYVQGVDVNNNFVPDIYYTDASFRYSFTDDKRQQIYLTVNNVWNQAPPLAPAVSGTHLRYSNFSLYDDIGRYFSLGVRFAY